MRWLLMVGVLLVPSVARAQYSDNESVIANSLDRIAHEAWRANLNHDLDAISRVGTRSLSDGYSGGVGYVYRIAVPSYSSDIDAFQDLPKTKSQWKHHFRRTHAESVRSGTARAPRRIVVKSW